jgi:hypothetical protein
MLSPLKIELKKVGLKLRMSTIRDKNIKFSLERYKIYNATTIEKFEKSYICLQVYKSWWVYNCSRYFLGTYEKCEIV